MRQLEAPVSNAASELPVTTVGQVTDKYGGLLAAGTSYGLVTVGGQALPVAEARKLATLITEACDAAEEWQAVLAACQAAHEATGKEAPH
jgi:hypothetical protein